MADIEPTTEELKAIAALERLAKKWPATLALFSWSGTLCVVRLTKAGRFPDKISNGVITIIQGIPNDGRDPD